MNKTEKIKEKLKNFTPPPNYIAGIHNYCDRWCERCTFTSRCSSFSLGKELNFNDDSDISNQEFWDDLKAVFEATFDLIKEEAKKFDIDFSKIEMEEEEVKPDIIQKHPLAKISNNYALEIHKWLEEKGEYLKDFAYKLEIAGSKNLPSVINSIEVIQWYSTMLPAKLYRALSSLKFDEFDDELNDSDGSAKVALISIDRSMAAFALLLNHLEESEDDILHFLVALKKIKALTEKTFPEAQHFKRPGFDN